MKLYDSDLGHEVGAVNDNQIVSRWDDSYVICGRAVLDVNGVVGERGEVVGFFDDGKLYVQQRLMAQVAD